MRSAETTQQMAQFDLSSAQQLARAGTISTRSLQEAQATFDTANAALEQAKATLVLRKSELVSAEARLIEPDQPVVIPSRDACCVTVRAPVDGVVLNVMAESQQIVSSGTPLLEIGNPKDLEIVVHLLSSDAVSLAPGAEAEITDWGGPGVLHAVVRKIDPAAYTKVSALGIEEQRVDATLDLTDPYDAWQGLGHAFRVMVHIVTWRSEDAVTVPIGALFRRGTDWNVFRVVDGKAALTKVDIGHRNNSGAEVLGGLTPGDVVVVHPSDRVSDTVAVEARETGAS